MSDEILKRHYGSGKGKLENLIYVLIDLFKGSLL